MGVAIPIPRVPRSDDASGRMKRIRALAWLLDRSIPIGGQWRVGLDPVLGLLPGGGDFIGALLSLYILYEGGRLGLRPGLLVKMGGNILVDTLIGAIPLLGDLFDFAWQANSRNVALIERHYQPALAPRSMGGIWIAFACISLVVLAVVVGLAYLVLKAIGSLFA